MHIQKNAVWNVEKFMLIKEYINIDTTESQTSYVGTYLPDTLNGTNQGSSHMVNERLTICNAKKARRHKAASAIDETHTWISITIAINPLIIKIWIGNR